MADIKVKDVGSKTVKTLDKVAIAGERVKDSIVYTKTKAETMNNNESVMKDAVDKVEFVTNRGADEVVYRFNKHGKQAVKTTKDNVVKSKIKIKSFKKKLTEKRKIKKLNTKFNVKIKNVNKGIKNSQNTYKVAKNGIDNSKRGLKLAKETAKKTAQSIKAAVKATILAIKALIAGTKALIAAIIAGGWVAVVIVIILMMVGLLFSSIFGIFFSSDSSVGGTPMSGVIEEINSELGDKIIDIQKKETYDDFTITSNQAEWKEILAIYVAKVTKGNNEDDVITLDNNKIKILKQVFWDMNEVTYEIKTEMFDETSTDELGTTTTAKVSKKILYITISSKSVSEMETLYFFNLEQKEQVKELLKPEYDDLWVAVILGGDISTDEMFLKQIFSVPYEAGISFIITSGYGMRPDPFDKSKMNNHSGIDSVPIGSQKVTASAEGIVKSVTPTTEGGNTVIIEHQLNGDTYRTTYVHLKDNSIIVKKDQKVVAGQIIAEYGNTGTRSKGAHLHFTVQKFNNNTSVFDYLNPIYIFK